MNHALLPALQDDEEEEEDTEGEQDRVPKGTPKDKSKVRRAG